METSFYRFYSAIKYFISGIKKDFRKAEPSSYIKERGFGKKKLIDELIKRGIVERTERVDSDEAGKPTYKVKYKSVDKSLGDEEKKIEKMYSEYFKKLNEDGEGGVADGSASGDNGENVTGVSSSEGRTGPIVGKLEIGGKTKTPLISRRIYLTEKQLESIKKRLTEDSTCEGVGEIAYDTPKWCNFKTRKGKKDPAYKR